MKKNKRGLVIRIVIVSVALLLIAAAVLYFTTDIFRTKQSNFFKYMAEIPEILDLLEESQESKKYQNAKKSNKYTKIGEAVIEDSNNIANPEILNNLKIQVNSKVDNVSSLWNAEVNVKNMDQQLFNASFIRERNLYAFNATEIADGYIGIENTNLKYVAENIHMNYLDLIPNEYIPVSLEKLLEISEEDKTYLLNKYFEIIRKNIPTTAYERKSNVKVNIGEESYRVTKYSIDLSERSYIDLKLALFKELKKDSTAMNTICAKFRLLNMDSPYAEINNLNEAIENEIKVLENKRQTANTNDSKFVANIYEYKFSNIKTEIIIDDKKIEIEHIKEDDIQKANITLTNIINEEDEVIQEILNDEEVDSQNGQLSVYDTKDKNVKDDTVVNIEIEKTAQNPNLLNFFIAYKYGVQEKSAKIQSELKGTVSDNNIQNEIRLNLKNNTKTIEILYKESVKFADNVGEFTTTKNQTVGVLNNYDSESLKQFANSIKTQINNVYIMKAASIGINVNPIFIVE